MALGDVARQLTIAESFAVWLARSGISRRAGGLEPAIQLRHAAERVVGIDIARDAENRIARTIKVAVEAVHHLASQRTQARLPADAPPAHAMCIIKQFVERLGGDRRRIIGLALCFLDDDFHLARELARIDHRISVRIGLDLEALQETR